MWARTRVLRDRSLPRRLTDRPQTPAPPLQGTPPSDWPSAEAPPTPPAAATPAPLPPGPLPPPRHRRCCQRRRPTRPSRAGAAGVHRPTPRPTAALGPPGVFVHVHRDRESNQSGGGKQRLTKHPSTTRHHRLPPYLPTWPPVRHSSRYARSRPTAASASESNAPFDAIRDQPPACLPRLLLLLLLLCS